MKTLYTALGLLTYACLVLDASAQLKGKAATVEKLDAELQKKTECLNSEYLVFSPKAEPAEKKLPLVIYLHGAGGRGDDINKLRGQAGGVWDGVKKFHKQPCLLVAPQCLRGKGGAHTIWNAGDLNVLLQHVKATLPVDPERIYLTGNSMGGYGTWMWGASNPEHFAAIAPVSGGTGRGGPKDVTPKLQEWAKSLAQIPVYAFAGAKDKVVPAERSQTLVAAIKKAGGEKVKLRVYPDQAHNARSVVYNTGEFYEWLFSHKREAEAATE